MPVISEKIRIFAPVISIIPPEGSPNGMAAVLKTAGFTPVRVRVPHPPQPA